MRTSSGLVAALAALQLCALTSAAGECRIGILGKNNTCCNAGCKYCTGSLCGTDKLGDTQCCTSKITKSCLSTGGVGPCLVVAGATLQPTAAPTTAKPTTRAPTVATITPAPTASGGQVNYNNCLKGKLGGTAKTVCCNEKCGVCTGSYCGSDPLGDTQCCSSKITKYCTQTGGVGPCLIDPKLATGTPAPTPVVTTAAPTVATATTAPTVATTTAAPSVVTTTAAPTVATGGAPADAIDPATLAQGVAVTITSLLNNKPLKLKWSDEFEGTTLNTNKWIVMQGDGCDINNCNWGNNEKQTYRRENVRLEGGKLVLEAEKGTFTAAGTNYENIAFSNNYEYASGKIHSKGSGYKLKNGTPDPGYYDSKYGRVEIRVSFPIFKSGWSAAWQMPATYPREGAYGIWPRSGELDLAEHINDNSWSSNTAHYLANGASQLQSSGRFSSNVRSGSYHTYALERSSDGKISFYIDGALSLTPSGWPQPTAGLSTIAPFDQPFSVLLNLAILGNWPAGELEELFPEKTPAQHAADSFAGGIKHQFRVDYVRVWEEVPSRRQLTTAPDAATDELQQQQQQHRSLARSCGNSTPYGRSGATQSPMPWTLPEGADPLIVRAAYYDTGNCGRKRGATRGGFKGNAGGLRGRDGLNMSINPSSIAKCSPYVSSMGLGDSAVYTVSISGGAAAAAVVSIKVVTSDSQGGALKVLLDSDDCTADAAAVAETGGAVLMSETVLDAGAQLQWVSSVVPVPAGVHAFTVCGTAGSFNLHSLEFERSTAAFSPAGGAASSRGQQPVDKCFSTSCHVPPKL